VPSIAFSLAVREAKDLDFAPAAAFAAKLAALVLSKGLPERTLLNVNVPPGAPVAVAVTVQGRREHEGTIFEGLDPRRRTYYWIEEGKDHWISDEMSDIHAVRSGIISSARCSPTRRTMPSWAPSGAAPGAGRGGACERGGGARKHVPEKPVDTEGPRGKRPLLAILRRAR
jgi:hypothetical protein